MSLGAQYAKFKGLGVPAKLCFTCMEVKAKVDFGKTIKKCLDCTKKYKNEWASRHPDVIRNKDLRRIYGITLVEFKDLMHAQENKCAICQSLFTDDMRLVHVDHDHNTGRVRGILCFSCNNGLGCFKDDIAVLEAAATYLKKTEN